MAKTDFLDLDWLHQRRLVAMYLDSLFISAADWIYQWGPSLHTLPMPVYQKVLSRQLTILITEHPLSVKFKSDAPSSRLATLSFITSVKQQSMKPSLQANMFNNYSLKQPSSKLRSQLRGFRRIPDGILLFSVDVHMLTIPSRWGPILNAPPLLIIIVC